MLSAKLLTEITTKYAPELYYITMP